MPTSDLNKKTLGSIADFHALPMAPTLASVDLSMDHKKRKSLISLLYAQLNDGVGALFKLNDNRNLGLDAVRGLAILLVVIGHTTPSRMPHGGAVGVTLFFVLSGFLITRLLFVELQIHGLINFRAFYVRRILRLYPGLLFFTVLTPLALAALNDSRFQIKLVIPSVITLAYLTDFFTATGRSVEPYGHTWSLAVEEQFYLIWPLLFYLIARKLRNRRIVWTIALLAAAAIIWREISAFVISTDWAYNSPDGNAFGLLLGAFIAVTPFQLSPRIATWTAVIGAMAVTVCTFLPIAPFGSTSNIKLLTATVGPGIALLGVLVVLGARDARLPLCAAPLVALGRLSYGLYLWHAMFYQTDLAPDGGPRVKLIMLLAAGLMALASWCFIERPALKLRSRFIRVAEGDAVKVGGLESPADLAVAKSG